MNFPISLIDSKIGLINVFNQDNIFLIEKQNIFLGDFLLTPDCKTTLNNFFNDFVTYLGVYKGRLQFQIGLEINLFETVIWCNEFKVIDFNRIMTVYQLGTARDYNFINGCWK